MKGRRLLDGTLRDFPPSVLDAMRHALDWSWAPLADRFDIEGSASAARLTLANIIVGLAEHGATDPAEMARQAIDLFLLAEKGCRCPPNRRCHYKFQRKGHFQYAIETCARSHDPA